MTSLLLSSREHKLSHTSQKPLKSHQNTNANSAKMHAHTQVFLFVQHSNFDYTFGTPNAFFVRFIDTVNPV